MLLIVLARHCRRDRRMRLGVVTAGAASSLLVICGPFFVAAPRQTWTMVVLDQLHRSESANPLIRLTQISGVGQLDPQLPLSHTASAVVIVIASPIGVALTVRAWGAPCGRIVVVLTLAQFGVLASSPSWFAFYDDSMAPGLALLIAAAAWPRAAPRPGRRIPRVIGIGALVGVTAFAVVIDIDRLEPTVRPYPAAALAASVAQVRCVMSDSPMALIELDVLSRDFSDRCRNWVNVTGRIYGTDETTTEINGRPEPRRDNVKWQQGLTAYLLSGGAFTILRPSDTGIGPALRSLLVREHVLSHAHGYETFATRPPNSQTRSHDAG